MCVLGAEQHRWWDCLVGKGMVRAAGDELDGHGRAKLGRKVESSC